MPLTPIKPKIVINFYKVIQETTICLPQIKMIQNPIRNKLIHPRVLKVLSQLRVPTPEKVPKDLSQPISGDLRKRSKLSLLLPSINRNIVNAIDNILTLNSSRLMKRGEANDLDV